MPRRSVIRDEKAISPVIATIIIVAVAIVMSIAVAYWALGLTGVFTRYEKLEIVAMYATTTNLRYSNKTGNTEIKWEISGWNVTAKLRNTGSATATVNIILINGKPIDIFNGTAITVYKVTGGEEEEEEGLCYVWVLINGEPLGQALKGTGAVLNPGDERTFVISIPRALLAGINFAPGMSIEITFHTATGSDYPKVVVLP